MSSAPTTPTPAIPPGSLVLVTGANGFIASHIILQLLQRGYRVRGTVRDVAKYNGWLADEVFAEHARSGGFELVAVPDFAAPDAFAQAVRGVAGIIHVATVTTLDPDPDKVIPPTVAAATGLLAAAAAAQESSVRRFVLTSSAGAVAMPTVPNLLVGRDTYNEVAVQLARSMPAGAPGKGGVVYMASKVAAEKAVWEFVEREKPRFAVNVVCPYTALGPVLHRNQRGAMNVFVVRMYQGLEAPVKLVPSFIAIHVDDVALLHVAALLDPSVDGSRMHAWNEPCNWKDVADIIHEHYPKSKVATEIEDSPRPTLRADMEEPLRLLQVWGGQHGYKTLEVAIRDVIEGIGKDAA